MSAGWSGHIYVHYILFLVENKKLNHFHLCQQKFQNVFWNRINAFTSFLYKHVIVFSQISFWRPARFIHVYNGSHELWCNPTLKNRSTNTSLLAEVALLLPLPSEPHKVPISWHQQDPFLPEPPPHSWAACHWAVQLPPCFSVHRCALHTQSAN